MRTEQLNRELINNIEQLNREVTKSKNEIMSLKLEAANNFLKSMDDTRPINEK